MGHRHWAVNDAALVPRATNGEFCIRRVVAVREDNGAPVVRYGDEFKSPANPDEWKRCGTYRRRLFFGWTFQPFGEIDKCQNPPQ